MQFQIHHAEGELAHLHIGAAEIAGAPHLLEKLFGNGFAGLVMAREFVQRCRAPCTSSP